MRSVILRPEVLAVALSALSLVAAQTNVCSNFTVIPAAIPLGTRSDWCRGELNTCSTLCAGNPSANSCDPPTLGFECKCQNGSAPGLEYYSQSMPSFKCQQMFQDCITANVGNQAGQTCCTNNIQKTCGTLDANKADVGGGGSASTSSSASGTATGTAAAGASSTAAHSGAAATNVALLGNGAAAVAAGLFAVLL